MKHDDIGISLNIKKARPSANDLHEVRTGWMGGPGVRPYQWWITYDDEHLTIGTRHIGERTFRSKIRVSRVDGNALRTLLAALDGEQR